jgi:hypothetical protein
MNFGSLVSRNRSTLNAWRLREAEWIEQTRVAGVPIAANATGRGWCSQARKRAAALRSANDADYRHASRCRSYR